MIFGILFGGVFLPASSVFAQNTNIESFENQDYENRVEGMCKILPPGTNITGCILEGYYYAILYPSFYFAYFTGSIFDYFLAYSISTGSYTGTNNQFVERGWSIIRDISNIAFIFSLLYVAIKHILQAATSETKRFLKSIIIAALLINFSLFFTKIIIDAGNILARAFYSNIEVPLDDNPDHKSISQGVIQYVNPQKLMSSDMFTPTLSPGRPPEEVNNGWVFMIMLVATIINVIIALTFLSVFLLFAARVIGLWFMMIFSPLAFVSTAIPNGSSILGRFGFSRWLKETTSLSFMAPVFMFFLFLLVMFLDIAFTTVTPFNNQSSVQKFMAILVPFIAVVVILNAAKKSAKDMAGEFGEQITKWAGKVAGFAAAGALGVAGGVVFGGAAAAGRGVIGRFASQQAGSAKTRRWAAKSGIGRRYQRLMTSASQSSFDFRNTGLSKRTTGLLNQAVANADMGITEKLSFGEGTKRGGYVQRLEEYQKKKEKVTESLKSSDTDSQNTGLKDVNGKEIVKSVVEAETDLLRAQNEAKRKTDSRSYDIKDENGNVVQTITESIDYDAWVKKRDGAEKERRQAETDYANAQRNARRDSSGAIIRDQKFIDAEKAYDLAKQKHEGTKAVIKDIESNWKEEEKVFKAVQLAKNKQDTKVLRDYAQSVKQNGLTWAYEVANLRTIPKPPVKVWSKQAWKDSLSGGFAKDARDGASASIGLAAEKSEKKAQAQEKKDNS